MRPFRFGFNLLAARSASDWAKDVRRLEDMGFAVLQVGDHYADITKGHIVKPTSGAISDEHTEAGTFAPLPALMAAAASTTTMRLCPSVLNNDFRNPAVVAKDLATIDVLSDGRVEAGLGCGNYHGDYEVLGLPFERPGVRIARLEEAISIVKQLLETDSVEGTFEHYDITSMTGPRSLQRPYPPFVIGCSGPRMLALAARHADIVAILRDPTVDFAEQIQTLRNEAGERFDDLEINVSVRPGKQCGWDGQARSLSIGGPLDEQVTYLQHQRAEHNVSYLSLMDTFGPPDQWADLVTALAGN